MKSEYLINKSEMEISVLATALAIKAKASIFFSTCWGWITTVFGMLLTFLLPIQYMFILLFTIIIVDAVFGLIAANKQNIPITSSKARQTVNKMLIYFITLSLAYAIEYIFHVTIIIKVLFVIACLVELYSAIANVLIIKPDMPFFRLFEKIVKGEIVKKSGIKEEDVNDILKK